MPQFYCHPCAVANKIVIPAEFVNLTGTAYQLEKYVKHTVSADSYQFVSIFDNPEYDDYSGYIVTGSISGMLEIDDYGRKNWLWYAGRRTGALFVDGEYSMPASGIKIVFPEDDTKIHAYPVTSSPGTIHSCTICGRDLPLW